MTFFMENFKANASKVSNFRDFTPKTENQKELLKTIYQDLYGGYPVYYRSQYKTFSSSGFVSDTESFFNLIKTKRKIHLSIFNKKPEWREHQNGKTYAKNIKTNSVATRFLIVDIDSSQIFSTEDAYATIEALENHGLYYKIPKPTYIVHSGAGLHLYYCLKDYIFLNYEEKTTKHKDGSASTKKELDQNSEKILEFYQDMTEKIKGVIHKSLKEIVPQIKNNGGSWNVRYVLNSLRVDPYVKGIQTQLIRAPGSYNSNAKVYTKILRYNPENKYSLYDFSNYKKLISYIRQENGIFELHPFRNSKRSYTEEDAYRLNLARLEDIETLIKLRKQGGTLRGSRQNILSHACWILWNLQDCSKEVVNVYEKLRALGELIGSEFDSDTWIMEKIRHANTYYSKNPHIRKESTIKFLNITKEEQESLTVYTTLRKRESPSKRKRSKKEKEEKDKRKKVKKERDKRIAAMYEMGTPIKKIARELDLSKNTIRKVIRNSGKQ